MIVTRNQVEALHLEQNLIKRHRPAFNIRLRDDKSFPYIAVTVEDDFPRVMFTRERHRRGVQYFGPYRTRRRSGDAGRPQSCLPLPAVRGSEAGTAFRHPVPRLPHRPLPRALRRLRLEGRHRADHRAGDGVPLGGDPADSPRARAENAGGCRGRTLRGGRALSQPPVCRAAHGRAPGGGQARGGNRRRDRHSRRGRPRRSAGLPAPRRQADRPLRLPSRERPGPGSACAARRVRARVLRLVAERAAADRRAARGGGHLGARGVPVGAARLARRGARRRPRGETPAGRAGRAERPHRARVGRGPVRTAPAAARRGAGGAARGAQPREPADPDRVLRHLPTCRRRHPSARWSCSRTPFPRKSRLPQVRRAWTWTARTTSPRWRRWSPAGSRDAGCDRRRVRRLVRGDAEPCRGRRRQGPAFGRAGGHAGVRSAAGRRHLFGQARGGGIPPGRSPGR